MVTRKIYVFLFAGIAFCLIHSVSEAGTNEGNTFASLTSWRIIDSDSKNIVLIQIPCEDKKNAQILKIYFQEPVSAMMGGFWELHGNLRWQIDYSVKALFEEPEKGRVYMALKCFSGQGDDFLWVNIPWMGENDIHPSEDYLAKRCLVELPAGTKKALLFLRSHDFKGTVWLKDLNISPFKKSYHPKTLLDAMHQRRWGATGWFVEGVVTVQKAVKWIEDKTLRDTACKLLRAAGLTVSRTMHFWDWLEPKPGIYDFSRLEEEIDDLSYYDVQAALIVHGVPEWAHGKTNKDLPLKKQQNPRAMIQPFFPPKDWTVYENFIEKLGDHFKGKIKIWECMNEVDTDLSGFNNEYLDYVKFLQIFHDALKRVDPENEIWCTRVGGSWLPKLLELGAGNYCDAFTTHPYHTEPEGAFVRAKKCELALAAAGVNKPLYVTEIGFSSGDWPGGPGHREDERRKANAGREAIELLKDMTDVIIWYDALLPGKRHGLIRNDTDRLIPMPVYYEMGDITGNLPKEGGPFQIEVSLPGNFIKANETVDITLKAINRTRKTLHVKFWPVGFVTNLGINIDQIRKHDWVGDLKPEQSYDQIVSITPTQYAQGTYPVGLAVLSDIGNSLWLENIVIVKSDLGCPAK